LQLAKFALRQERNKGKEDMFGAEDEGVEEEEKEEEKEEEESSKDVMSPDTAAAAAASGLPPDVAALIAVTKQLKHDADKSASRRHLSQLLREVCVRAGWSKAQIAAEDGIAPLTDASLLRMALAAVEGRPRPLPADFHSRPPLADIKKLHVGKDTAHEPRVLD
jgi:hypothetical protein